MKTRDFSFGVAILDCEPAPDDELRAVSNGWTECFRGDPFTNDASSKGVVAWSVGYEAAAKNTELLAERLAGIPGDLKSLPTATDS